jgi:hypothetical protein
MVCKTLGKESDAVAGAARARFRIAAFAAVDVLQIAALLIFVLLFDFMCKLLHAVVLLMRMLQLVNLSEHNWSEHNAHFVPI